ncbi:MAG: hypothetical protein M1393_00050 [Candidatus Thermoplasmatota archaeon]|nr:hypothetical protein [Candidatus Thermoplasmatota archaeon]MDA8143058.1 hypothetical protein [Thermoplasmatales archaeon]
MKDLAKSVIENIEKKNLREAIDLINYMSFQMNENLEKLGKNSDHVRSFISGKSEKEVKYAIMNLLQDLYSDDLITTRFLAFLRENRYIVFM